MIDVIVHTNDDYAVFIIRGCSSYVIKSGGFCLAVIVFVHQMLRMVLVIDTNFMIHDS